MKLFDKIKKWITKRGIDRAKKNSNILKEALDHPDRMILIAYIEDDEIVVKIKSKRKKKKTAP